MTPYRDQESSPLHFHLVTDPGPGPDARGVTNTTRLFVFGYVEPCERLDKTNQ